MSNALSKASYSASQFLCFLFGHTLTVIFISFNICGQKIGNSVFFDCSSKKWFQIVAGLEIWAKIEHSFVRPILINFTLQIMRDPKKQTWLERIRPVCTDLL